MRQAGLAVSIAIVGLVLLAGCTGLPQTPQPPAPETTSAGGESQTATPVSGEADTPTTQRAWYRFDPVRCQDEPWGNGPANLTVLAALYPGVVQVHDVRTNHPVLGCGTEDNSRDVYALLDEGGSAALLLADGWKLAPGPPAKYRGEWYRFDLQQCQEPPWGAAGQHNGSAIIAHYGGVDEADVRNLGGAYPAACGIVSGFRAYALLVDGESNATLLSDEWRPSSIGPSHATSSEIWYRYDVPACFVAPGEPWAAETTDGPVPIGERARIHYHLRGAVPLRVVETTRNVTATPECPSVHATSWFMQLEQWTTSDALQEDGWASAAMTVYCYGVPEDGGWEPAGPARSSRYCD